MVWHSSYLGKPGLSQRKPEKLRHELAWLVLGETGNNTEETRRTAALSGTARSCRNSGNPRGNPSNSSMVCHGSFLGKLGISQREPDEHRLVTGRAHTWGYLGYSRVNPTNRGLVRYGWYLGKPGLCQRKPVEQQHGLARLVLGETRDIPKETRRTVARSGMDRTCGNPGFIRGNASNSCMVQHGSHGSYLGKLMIAQRKPEVQLHGTAWLHGLHGSYLGKPWGNPTNSGFVRQYSYLQKFWISQRKPVEQQHGLTRLVLGDNRDIPEGTRRTWGLFPARFFIGQLGIFQSKPDEQRLIPARLVLGEIRDIPEESHRTSAWSGTARTFGNPGYSRANLTFKDLVRYGSYLGKPGKSQRKPDEQRLGPVRLVLGEIRLIPEDTQRTEAWSVTARTWGNPGYPRGNPSNSSMVRHGSYLRNPGNGSTGNRHCFITAVIRMERNSHGWQLDELAVTQSGADSSPLVPGGMSSTTANMMIEKVPQRFNWIEMEAVWGPGKMGPRKCHENIPQAKTLPPPPCVSPAMAAVCRFSDVSQSKQFVSNHARGFVELFQDNSCLYLHEIYYGKILYQCWYRLRALSCLAVADILCAFYTKTVSSGRFQQEDNFRNKPVSKVHNSLRSLTETLTVCQGLCKSEIKHLSRGELPCVLRLIRTLLQLRDVAFYRLFTVKTGECGYKYGVVGCESSVSGVQPRSLLLLTGHHDGRRNYSRLFVFKMIWLSLKVPYVDVALREHCVPVHCPERRGDGAHVACASVTPIATAIFGQRKEKTYPGSEGEIWTALNIEVLRIDEDLRGNPPTSGIVRRKSSLKYISMRRADVTDNSYKAILRYASLRLGKILASNSSISETSGYYEQHALQSVSNIQVVECKLDTFDIDLPVCYLQICEPGQIPGGVACSNRAERCCWLMGFLGVLPLPPPFHSGVAPYSPRFTLIGSQDVDGSSTASRIAACVYNKPYRNSHKTKSGRRYRVISVLTRNMHTVVIIVAEQVTQRRPGAINKRKKSALGSHPLNCQRSFVPRKSFRAVFHPAFYCYTFLSLVAHPNSWQGYWLVLLAQPADRGEGFQISRMSLDRIACFHTGAVRKNEKRKKSWRDSDETQRKTFRNGVSLKKTIRAEFVEAHKNRKQMGKRKRKKMLKSIKCYKTRERKKIILVGSRSPLLAGGELWRGQITANQREGNNRSKAEVKSNEILFNRNHTTASKDGNGTVPMLPNSEWPGRICKRLLKQTMATDKLPLSAYSVEVYRLLIFFSRKITSSKHGPCERTATCDSHVPCTLLLSLETRSMQSTNAEIMKEDAEVYVPTNDEQVAGAMTKSTE
ncbi:hypothetical protein PR048_032973 [Dryococelus australis]|uniref:Uncharacterized protein n=1 Tax=Dryococelus australis TaxID=614101 RepID=A0ABQ9G3S4_9NEOP|nr:hypothetical protein PR048_032973 [Dryococelus australis]